MKLIGYTTAPLIPFFNDFMEKKATVPTDRETLSGIQTKPPTLTP